MSEQTKILDEMSSIIMAILKSGSATEGQGKEIDKLEDLLFAQKCFNELQDSKHAIKGEEIASLFFTNKNEEAINKLLQWDISPEDFFGFAEYHYDDEEEPLVEMFTEVFISDINKAHQIKLESK